MAHFEENNEEERALIPNVMLPILRKSRNRPKESNPLLNNE